MRYIVQGKFKGDLVAELGSSHSNTGTSVELLNLLEATVDIR